MTITHQPTDVTAVPGLRVAYDGQVYAAEMVGRGAAYELFSEQPEAGFQPDPRGGAARWRRFVHATEVAAIYAADDPPAGAPAGDLPETPLRVPLSRMVGWTDVHRWSQTPARGGSTAIDAIRATATVRRGTRMMKVLSAHQLAGCLSGWPPSGFCYREYDIAHLRTPDALRLVRTDPDTAADTGNVTFALRWPAVDPADYDVPTPAVQSGLIDMPPHDRVGPPVLGTGFTPSEHHIIPEFTTAALADLPLPANATLLAYPADGSEVVLYTYQPEQRGWLRMVGAQWRHLLAGVNGVSATQEYVPVAPAGPTASSRLVGWFRGREHDAVADPPTEFRVLAMTRAARYPVESLLRRTHFTWWRRERCTVVRQNGSWVRLRLSRPSPEAVVNLGARCYERGVYETWAPTAEISRIEPVDTPYAI
ncbi:MAG TPA: hypothetical protein VFR67_04140 [Pilimelia sp.]|nr:hypothetical protein [Pilimelia sp.]